MTVPDDSALIHGGVYDPVKARAYYLKTRHLKGRRPGSGPDAPTGGRPRVANAPGKDAGSSRQKEIAAQKAALEKRLDRLRDILTELVAKAKHRSGVKDNTHKDDTPQEKASRNEHNKKSTPLTEKQKREKAAKARADYQKQKGLTDSEEVQQLQRQIADIRAKIQKALDEARRLSSQSHPKTASKGR